MEVLGLLVWPILNQFFVPQGPVVNIDTEEEEFWWEEF